jgi:hypothetical protein
MLVTAFNGRERERAVGCAKGMRQHELICKMLEHDDVPEPVYGISPDRRRYKMSAQPSFDAMLDRLEQRGFTVLVRAVDGYNNLGHDRFYSLRRTRDAKLADPLVTALESAPTNLLERRLPDGLPRAATAQHAAARESA